MEPAVTAKGLESVLNLAVYGPLGILAILGVLVSVVLYVHGRKDRHHFEIQLKESRESADKALNEIRKVQDAERKEHATIVREMMERHGITMATHLEKYHALAESMNRALESSMRRYLREDGQARIPG